MHEHLGKLNALAQVTYEPGRDCPAVAFFISERESSQNRWRIQVAARLEQGGAHNLGVVRTTAATISQPDGTGYTHSRRPGARCVFIACCPGALGWSAWVEKTYQADGDGAKFNWSDCPEAIGLPGIMPLFGFLEHPRYTYHSANLAGGGGGSATIRANERVMLVSAWQVGDGGWFRIIDPVEGNLHVVTLPPDGSATIRPEGTLWGPCTISCDFTANAAGKGGYLIEGLR